MNEYSEQKKALLELVANGELKLEEIEEEIKVFEFLESCSSNMINTLFDSGAFNHIVKGYVRLAADISKVNLTGRKILLDNISLALDQFDAADVSR